MSSRAFRKIALERLSAPNQLDGLPRITRPVDWLALLLLIACIGAGLLWGWYGSVPLDITSMAALEQSRDSAKRNEDIDIVMLLPPESAQYVRVGLRATIIPICAGRQSITSGHITQIDRQSTDQQTWVRIHVGAPAKELRACGYSDAGTGLNSRIAVKLPIRQRPLSMLIPALDSNRSTSYYNAQAN